ncbi:uncharacterized protein LOC126706837 isoform X2 [Quercus robur]|uniref:uncharacterized protein LOC126706837 isoform X2 n=1 Tax=Quercus robur TaxID=38942 RepID=UPI002161A31B|nr:uncharacterized protein LOC126706837 isoform X2 [Quercus robur]
MLKLHSIGGFDSPKLVVTQMEGGYETANIPLEKQCINQSHAMPCRDEHKPNMDSDEATRRFEQSLTSIRDDMLVLHNTMNVIAKNMETFKKDIVLELKNVIANNTETFKNEIVLELKNVFANNTETFKNDICLELKNVAKRERTGHTIDLDLNDIVEDLKNETKVLPKKESTSLVQEKMDHDDIVHVKKESKKESTFPIQDKRHQDDTSKPICLELKNVAKREYTGHTIDLDLNDIVEELKNETNVLPKKESTSPVQDKMDQDDTVHVKKESKKKSTSPVQDKMHQDDTIPIKREFKTVSPSPIQDTIENDRNVRMVGLSKSIQEPGSKTVLSRNVDVDMLQLTFSHNNRIIASCVTHSAKSKVTKSLKRSPIVTSQVVVPNLKKMKKIKDTSQTG